MIQTGQCVCINCFYSTAICLAILWLFSEHLDQVTVRKNVSHSKSQNSVLFRLWFLQWLRLILMQKSWNQFIVSFQQILLRLPGILLFQCTCGKILRVNCRDALDYWESGNSKQLIGQKIGLVRFYELESNTERVNFGTTHRRECLWFKCSSVACDCSGLLSLTRPLGSCYENMSGSGHCGTAGTDPPLPRLPANLC